MLDGFLAESRLKVSDEIHQLYRLVVADVV
jgi:hypothetical protein